MYIYIYIYYGYAITTAIIALAGILPSSEAPARVPRAVVLYIYIYILLIRIYSYI